MGEYKLTHFDEKSMNGDIILPTRGRIRSTARPLVGRRTVIAPVRPARDMRVTDFQMVQAPLVKEETSSATKPGPKQKKPRKARRFVTVAVVAIILGATGYLSIDTWLTNKQVQDQVQAQSGSSSTATTAQEGADETPLPDTSLQNYKVAADLPRALTIEKLGVKARILPMGVNRDGSMQAPVGIYDSGWYMGSARPGSAGAAVIDGHASGPTREGLFASLDKLALGDKVSVERGNGSLVNYEVIYTETVALDAVDMNQVLLPRGNSKEGLNLITCTGQWLKEKNTYDHRVIVYTKRILS